MTSTGAADADSPAPAPAVMRWIAARGPWQRLGLAMLAGAAMTLGQVPIGLPWVLFLAVPVLAWLLDATPGWRGAAAVGWGAGFGYFVTGLVWIGNAFLVDADRFAWMMPFAVTLLPAFLGLFWAGAFALARRGWKAAAIWRVASLAAWVTVAEYARAHVLTGFPWGMPGYVWVDTPVMQAGAWAGPYGMTFLTVALTGLPLVALAVRQWLAGIAALAAVAALWGAGWVWLAEAPAIGSGGLVVRLVQPDSEQNQKWDPKYAPIFYARMLADTSAPPDPALGPPVAVIWPETSVAFLPAYKPDRRAEIAAAANGAPVLMGTLHARLWNGEEQWFNSLMAILPDASVGPRYDKHHLVPFGEYLPYPDILGPIGFRQLVKQGGFVPGEGPQVMVVPGLPPFSPLICYEMIFPDEVVPPGERPDWLLQVTNDGWYGSYGGPQQHLAQARIRAIEQGLPVARAASTGISAMIDPYGRVTASLPLHGYGHVDARLPGPLPETFYARHGDLPAMVLVLLTVFLSSRAAAGRRRG